MRAIGPRNKTVMKMPLEQMQDAARDQIRKFLSRGPMPNEWIGTTFVPFIRKGSYDLALQRVIKDGFKTSGWKGFEGIRYQSYQGKSYREPVMIASIWSDWSLWERWILPLKPTEKALKRLFAWTIHAEEKRSYDFSLKGALR